MSQNQGHDYIIVGGGSAGCVLANRLSADGTARVLLVEAGAKDWNPLIRVPVMASFFMRHKYHNWAYATQPEPHLNNRRIDWPRGRVLGGSSAINGMVMMAGDSADLRRFGGSALVSEMLQVTDELAPRPRSHGPLSMAFRRAARQLGHASAPSSAKLDQTGLLTTALALDDSGRRSAAQLYLGSAASPGKNVRIEGNTEVVGLVRQGQRVTGVRAIQGVEDGRHNEVTFSARHVVLSMGALVSPRSASSAPYRSSAA